MNYLAQSLEQNAELYGIEPRFFEYQNGQQTKSFSWKQIRDKTLRIAAKLQTEKPGSIIIAALNNRVEMFCSILGGILADQWILPLPSELPEAKLKSIIKDLPVKQAIAEQSVVDCLKSQIPDSWNPDSITSTLDQKIAYQIKEIEKGSLLLQSSGTTGAPKIARRNIDALIADGNNCVNAVGIKSTDRMISVLPLYHSYGIDHVILAVTFSGCSLEIHDRFIPSVVRKALEEDRINIMPAVPLMVDALSRGFTPTLETQNLRQIYTAGSPLPKSVAQVFKQNYGIGISQIYGASEFGSVTFNDSNKNPYDPESVGLPMNGVQVKVLDRDNPDFNNPLPIGAKGQVAISAPSMMIEYIDNPTKPNEDNFILTGDLGYLDSLGRLYITGRVKLLIDVAGLKVNPLEVEAVLTSHPAVKDAIVIPIHYSKTASRLKAIIVPKEDNIVNKGDLQKFAGEHLIHYKVPRVFEICKTVPRSPTGKILRQELISSQLKK